MARSRLYSVQAILGAVALLVIPASAAVAVQVSLPSNAIITAVGQTTVVDIDIGSVSNLEALGLSITYSEAIADVLSTGAVQRGSLTTNCDSTVINITEPGRLTITAACAGTPITGTGTLFSVTFTGIANGVTPLTFSTFTVNGMVLIPDGCLLNEGTPTCEPVNGQLTVGPTQPTSTASATGTVTATRTATATTTATGTRTNTVASTAAATPTSTTTRTSAATVTNTPTTGPSPTVSQTLTASTTPTITPTPSVTLTPSITGTATATSIVTNTGSPTRTRPGVIPVVPSPAGPPGLVLIGGLAAALLWALRRLARRDA